MKWRCEELKCFEAACGIGRSSSSGGGGGGGGGGGRSSCSSSSSSSSSSSYLSEVNPPADSLVSFRCHYRQQADKLIGDVIWVKDMKRVSLTDLTQVREEQEDVVLTLKPQDDRSGFYLRYDKTEAAYQLYHVFALVEKTVKKSGRTKPWSV